MFAEEVVCVVFDTLQLMFWRQWELLRLSRVGSEVADAVCGKMHRGRQLEAEADEGSGLQIISLWFLIEEK